MIFRELFSLYVNNNTAVLCVRLFQMFSRHVLILTVVFLAANSSCLAHMLVSFFFSGWHLNQSCENQSGDVCKRCVLCAETRGSKLIISIVPHDDTDAGKSWLFSPVPSPYVERLGADERSFVNPVVILLHNATPVAVTLTVEPPSWHETGDRYKARATFDSASALVRPHVQVISGACFAAVVTVQAVCGQHYHGSVCDIFAISDANSTMFSNEAITATTAGISDFLPFFIVTCILLSIAVISVLGLLICCMSLHCGGWLRRKRRFKRFSEVGIGVTETDLSSMSEHGCYLSDVEEVSDEGDCLSKSDEPSLIPYVF